MKYIFPLILGCIAAFLTGEILALSGTQATFDAWVLTLTIAGHDVGDRMALVGRMLFSGAPLDTITSVGYILGQSLLEESLKFFVFFIALKILKPASIFQIMLSGIAVGVGFAAVENFTYYEYLTFSQSIITFSLRALGHSLFTGVIGLLYGLGYFSQLRWIDAGAHGGFRAWLLRYGEFGVAFIFTGIGIICASLFHAGVDILIAFGGQSIVVPFMAVGWFACIIFLQTPGASRPYGMLLQKFELMHTIQNANRELNQILQYPKPRRTTTHQAFRRKSIRSGKQFAKT